MARKNILPIGVDIGCSSAKLVQMVRTSGDPELASSATMSIPPHLQNDQIGQLDYLCSQVPRYLRSGNFQGKKCVLSLPATSAFIRHVRVPKREASAMEKSIRIAARTELPYPPDQAVLRHILAGEVYRDGVSQQEVILVAIPISTLRAYLNMISRSGLEAICVTIEPMAIVCCFKDLLEDPQEATVFVDLGSVNTQVTITRGQNIAFCRNLQGGSEQLAQAIAQALRVSPQEVHSMRWAIQEGKDVGAAGEEIQRWMELWLDGLCGDVETCLRYYEAVFRDTQFARVIFTGGQAADRRLCQALARRLNLPAQIGDPMALFGDGQGTSGAARTDLAVGAGLSLCGMEL
jgi:type IV pilus assembly protein PilM